MNATLEVEERLDWVEFESKRLEFGSMDRSVTLAIFDPKTMQLNNSVVAKNGILLLEPEKAAVVDLHFEPKPLDIQSRINLTFSVGVGFFDKAGVKHWKVIPLGSSGFDPKLDDYMHIFDISAAALLPFDRVPLIAKGAFSKPSNALPTDPTDAGLPPF